MNIQLLKRECSSANKLNINTPYCIVSAVGATNCSYNKIDLILGMSKEMLQEEEYLTGI